ncbi:hypothetical protein NKW57_15880, partial [Acetobacter cerevisiae]|nr:hypothetical protein [Acetobacter cerevisiae]
DHSSSESPHPYAEKILIQKPLFLWGDYRRNFSKKYGVLHHREERRSLLSWWKKSTRHQVMS